MPKKKYIEVEVIDWKHVALTIILYPAIVVIGIMIFIINFIIKNLKLLSYLVISFIPILNISIMGPEKDDLISMYEDFEFDLSLLKTKKRVEVFYE